MVLPSSIRGNAATPKARLSSQAITRYVTCQSSCVAGTSREEMSFDLGRLGPCTVMREWPAHQQLHGAQILRSRIDQRRLGTYNLKRAMQIVGVAPLVAAIRA